MPEFEQKELVTALREAIQEIAETMLFVEITPKQYDDQRCTLGADTSAVIGYSGALKGSMRLAGPLPSVMKLAGALLGEERDTLDKEMEDAFSEMANMIAGGVQTRLEGTVGTIRMSPPVVISGKNHQVSSDHSFQCVSHQFELDGEPFFTEVFYAFGDHPVDDPQKYGFSLAVPMPRMPGMESVSDEAEAASALAVDGAQLAAAVREAFAREIEGWAQETARDLVRKLLPDLAERLVREEIERIKREGL
ncbi:MAG: chemotaxis protein CheX [Magnetococcales bacterium]|nr:chemotaxis protein CheX [Magnetococcales bacterium]